MLLIHRKKKPPFTAPCQTSFPLNQYISVSLYIYSIRLPAQKPFISSHESPIHTLLQAYIRMYHIILSHSKPSHLNPRDYETQLLTLLPLQNLLEFLKIQPPRPAPLHILMLYHI